MVRKRVEVQEDLQSRVMVFRAIIAIALIVLVGRLWFLQIILASKYNAMAQNNHIRERSIEAVRGNLYDRNNKLIVTSKPALSISVLPYIFEKNKKVQKRLSKLIKLPLKEIRKRMRDKKADPLKPKVIKRLVKKETVYYIKERPNEFKGVKIEILPERDYIYGSLAAHLIGYVGEVSEKELEGGYFKDVEMGDLVGKTGLENNYNSTLMGIRGKERIEINAGGRPVKLLNKKKPRAGSSIMLALDLKIQKYAEEAISQAVGAAKSQVDKKTGQRYAGKSGAVVVMDSRNGDVLAMASYPTYNPKLFLGGISKKNWKELTDKKNNYPINNRAVTGTYPPGSTFKPFVAIAGLQTNRININSTFYCSGSWKGSPKWPNVFKCWDRKGHGASNVRRALIVSCDVFFYNVGNRLYNTKSEPLQKWAKLFGFNSPTNIEIPSEAKGRVPTRAWKWWFNRGPGREKYRKWYPGDTVNLSIGQGDLLVTPIQMATATAAIANGGKVLKPRLVKAILTADGEVKKIIPMKINRKLNIKASNLAVVRQGMAGVTKGEGTASGVFANFLVNVAGKTGTAEIKGKQDTAWFISYAPAQNPRYVAVMVIEEGGHGGSVAAPAVKYIYGKIFSEQLKDKRKRKKKNIIDKKIEINKGLTD